MVYLYYLHTYDPGQKTSNRPGWGLGEGLITTPCKRPFMGGVTTLVLQLYSRERYNNQEWSVEFLDLDQVSKQGNSLNSFS